MKFGIKDKTMNFIVEEILNIPEIESALIFGSRAGDSFKNGSDIDIALKGKKISDEIVTRLSRKLNLELPVPYHIDLIVYDKISNKELVDHIDRVGKKLL